MKSILDDRFKYTPAASTDIGKRFAAWHRKYARMWDAAHKEKAERESPLVIVAGNVTAMPKKASA